MYEFRYTNQISMSDKKPIRRRRPRKDSGLDMGVVTAPRDMETMSMATCLNRIMIKVRHDDYNDETVESLKDDFAYVTTETSRTSSDVPISNS